MERPPSEPAQRGSFTRALVVAVMVTALYGALLVAVDGFSSLLLDRDIIAERDAGPLVGPVMAVAALVVVFLSLIDGLRPEVGRRRIPVGRAIGTTVLVYLAGPLAGAAVYVLGQDQVLSGALFFGKYLTSPFVITSAGLAGLVLLFLPVIGAARSRAR